MEYQRIFNCQHKILYSHLVFYNKLIINEEKYLKQTHTKFNIQLLNLRHSLIIRVLWRPWIPLRASHSRTSVIKYAYKKVTVFYLKDLIFEFIWRIKFTVDERANLWTCISLPETIKPTVNDKTPNLWNRMQLPKLLVKITNNH